MTSSAWACAPRQAAGNAGRRPLPTAGPCPPQALAGRRPLPAAGPCPPQALAGRRPLPAAGLLSFAVEPVERVGGAAWDEFAVRVVLQFGEVDFVGGDFAAQFHVHQAHDGM